MADIPTTPSPDVTIAPASAAISAGPSSGEKTATHGRRQAFRDLGRQLTNDDFASTGVQKLILEELERAELECHQYRDFVERYYIAERKVAVLEEKLKPARTIDVMFGVGIGSGSLIIGFAPSLWSAPPAGHCCLIVGSFLVIGATIGKLIKQ